MTEKDVNKNEKNIFHNLINFIVKKEKDIIYLIENNKKDDNNIKYIKPKINHAISLGLMCHTAMFLKKNKLKLESYPFDWIYSSTSLIIDILDDKFVKFLDKNLYINQSIGKIKNEHKIYGPIFRHHDPNDDETHNYFKRCVDRFNNILECKNNKLFIITCINDTFIFDEKKINIEMINKKLIELTTNYYLVCIYNKIGKEQNKNIFINNDIYYIELVTLSKSDGLKFSDDSDNFLYENILFNLFEFDIIENKDIIKK